MNEPLRILVVEDVPTDAELALHELRAGGLAFASERVETREAYLEALERFRPDLVLSDYSMPRFDGMQALQLLLERDPLVPFIVLTGSRNEHTAVECMKAGAADYVLKDHLGRLVSAVQAALERRQMLERQRQSEAALRESEACFSIIFHGSPVGILLSRVADGLIVDANEAFLSLLGRRREELVGRTTLELGMWPGPADRERFLVGLHERGGFQQFEPTASRRLGATADVLLSTRQVELGGGAHLLTMMTDITAHKAVEEKLRTFSRMVEQSPVCVVLTDPEGNIEYVNPKFCELTGYSHEEALGANPRILKSGLTPPGVYEEMWRAIRAGEEWHGEFCNRKKSGELYWEDASIGALRDASGRITHLLAVKEDITARKLAEAALRRSQEQLQQSQKMEAIGRLAGGVAHDFNNLISVIRGYTEIILRRLPDGDPARETHEVIFQAADRAAGLTRQLLAFSRKQVLEPKVVDLRDALGEMEKMLRRLIGEDVELVVTWPEQVGRVRIDPGQFEQVVLNLAVNSRDAMPDGGTLRFELSDAVLDASYARDGATMAGGSYVLLAVSDTGVGMDAETRARSFEPFFTTKDRARGTGLGLATVYGIIKQSGGYIWVDSEPGKGSTFKIYLPRVDAPVQPRQAPAGALQEHGLGETLLVVEDDALVRDLASQILAEQGYRVLTATDSGEALRLAGAERAGIALLLTDVILPGMNGRQLAERLRQDQPGLPVLFMSGYTDDVLARLPAAGAWGVLEPGVRFLQKPFTLASLISAVGEALAGRPAGVGAGSRPGPDAP